MDIISEAEVPSIIYKTFTSLGLERFKIRINNRKVLNGFFAILGLTEKAGDVMRTIDKLEKIGAEKVKTILVEDFGVEAATADEAAEVHRDAGRHRGYPRGAGELQGQERGIRPRRRGAENGCNLYAGVRRSGRPLRDRP